jgi:hypothetical protein
MYIFLVLSSALASGIVPVLAAGVTLQFTGTTLELGGIPYYVPPDPVSQIQVQSGNWQSGGEGNSAELIPISALSSNESCSLNSTISSWKARDDVWSESFLTGAYCILASW